MIYRLNSVFYKRGNSRYCRKKCIGRAFPAGCGFTGYGGNETENDFRCTDESIECAITADRRNFITAVCKAGFADVIIGGFS